MNKTCFKCNKRKHISQYYLHPKTRDKHLNKCKDCTKKDAREIRFNPKYREKILENDRLRNKNNKLRNKMIKNGYKTVKEYSIENTIDKIEQLYRKLINRNV